VDLSSQYPPSDESNVDRLNISGIYTTKAGSIPRQLEFNGIQDQELHTTDFDIQAPPSLPLGLEDFHYVRLFLDQDDYSYTDSEPQGGPVPDGATRSMDDEDMTEYDYSEEGARRFADTIARIAHWSHLTASTPQADPFAPRIGRAFVFKRGHSTRRNARSSSSGSPSRHSRGPAHSTELPIL
jgi:hypothetical protein